MRRGKTGNGALVHEPSPVCFFRSHCLAHGVPRVSWWVRSKIFLFFYKQTQTVENSRRWKKATSSVRGKITGKFLDFLPNTIFSPACENAQEKFDAVLYVANATCRQAGSDVISCALLRIPSEDNWVVRRLPFGKICLLSENERIWNVKSVGAAIIWENVDDKCVFPSLACFYILITAPLHSGRKQTQKKK